MMLGQSLRASRQLLARAARQQATAPVRRTLTTTSVRNADLVQELYLRELKAYKPTPVKATDSEGNVQKFSMPKPPASPEEADMASELKAYESQVPEVEGQAAEGGAAAQEVDWFEEPEEDEPAGAHH